MQRQQERGFAVLMIFVMAAAVAIFLYMQLPRVAFEAQRNKEELLISRGEQYKRAIQLYYRKTQRYPSKIEDLENFQNIRFLRRRYVDPMTGKDEWRFIHISGPGVYSDSLTRKPPATNKDGNAAAGANGGSTTTSGGTSTGTGTTTGALPGGTAGAYPTGVNPGAGGIPPIPGQDPGDTNPALRRRPSDRNPVGPGTAPENPGATPANTDPNQQPVIGPDGQPVQPNGTGQPYRPPAIPGLPDPYATPGKPTGTGQPGAQPGQPRQPGQPVPPVPGGATPMPGGPSSTGAQPSAGDLIYRQLTQPSRTGAATQGGTVFGAGIAGVASKREATGIKHYAERDKYNEWEFIYDPAEEAAAQMQGMAGGQNGGQNNGGQTQNRPQSPGFTPGPGQPKP